MASTILVKDALWRVAVVLQDTVPQFQYWPEHELVHWLNDAQAVITKYLPAACSRIDAIKLKAGTRQSIEKILAAECKPGDGSTPTVPVYGKMLMAVYRNMGADGLTPGNAIRMVDREVKDSQSPGWHGVTGTGAINAFMYDEKTPRYFYVTPGVPASPATWIELAYTAQPLQIDNTGTPGSERYLNGGSNTDTITIDDEYVDDLVNYVVSRAHGKGSKFGDPSKAALYGQMFMASLNSKVQAVTGNSPKLTLLPMASA